MNYLLQLLFFYQGIYRVQKRKRNNENIDIKIDGIRVKKRKNKIYFLLEMEPLTLIFCFNEFFISRKISKKNSKSRKISINNRYFKFSSLILTKLFSINVKKVTKPRINVIKNITTTNMFLFKNAIIN